jgi:hypothetical protein
MEKEDMKKNIQDKTTWNRGFFMLLFTLFTGIAKSLVFAVILSQFIFALITGSTNRQLLDFSRGLVEYINQMLKYLTYQSDVKPFPFTDWPQA